MRIVATPFLIGLALASSAQAANRTDREQQGLKGPVGSVRVEVAKDDYAGKVGEGTRLRTEKTVYDDKGNLTWQVFYSSDVVASSHYFHYESDGTQIDTAHVRRVLEPSASGPPGYFDRRFKLVHKLDTAGNRIETSVFADDGSLDGSLVYSYDKAGSLTSAAKYGSKGDLSEKWIYESNGSVKERDEFGEKGLVVQREFYSYENDSQGNWVKRITSRQVSSAGKVAPNPVELTFRIIRYYAPGGDFQMNGGVIPGGIPPSATPGEGTLTSNATRRVQAPYPSAARAARISGVVLVEVTVDEEGDVLSARAVSGHPLLKGAALDAAWDWRFPPTIYNGRRVKVIGTITFRFTL